MKILPGSQQATPAEPAENKAEKVVSPKKREPARPFPKGDQVDFSAPLSQGFQTQQELQSQRVESIKARIQAGTYQVSSRDVAEKMLSDSSDF